MTLFSTTLDVRTAAVLMVSAAWLLFAVWAVIRSARIGAQAQLAQAWGLRLRGLLSTAPGAYLIVGDEGHVTISDTLRSWLGLDSRAVRFEDIGPARTAGLEGAGFTELEQAIAATSVSGVPFSLTLKTAADGRLLKADGSSAPPEVAGMRGVVVWFSELTEVAERLSALERERDEQRTLLEATRGIIASVPLPVWRRNADLQLVDVNHAYAEAVEAASPTEAVRLGVELLPDSADLPPLKAAAQVRDGGRSMFREETAIVSGERKRLRIVETPLPSGDIAGLAIDISEIEAARLRYRHFAEAQADMLERLSAGVARFGPDRLLMTANRAFMRLFQVEEQFIATRPEFDRVLEHMREMRRLPEQRDFPGWRKERGEWFHSAERGIEETWVLPDNMVIRVLAQPEPDGGLLMIFEDQSERLRLASSREQLMRVQGVTLQNLREGVSVFAASGRLQFHNDAFARLWGIPEQVLARDPQLDEVFAAADVSVKEGSLEDLMRGLVRAASEGRSERSGRLELADDRYVRYSAVPLPDGNALCTFEDITDTERVEIALRERTDALQAADVAKSRFVENMSYELRTPLTNITGFGEMLHSGMAGTLTERQIDYVSSILISAERLRVMINGIIDLAASDVGALSLEAEDANVSDLIANSVDLLAGAAKDRGITVDWAVEEEASTLICDRMRMRQALYNLIANALRFTPDGGQVEIRAVREAAGVSVRIKDRGIGVPKDELPRVFERFYKASNAARTSGVGLGLPLVREVAELHGGSVELQPRDGGGTVAVLQLPDRPARTLLASTDRSGSS
ncbi:hypothetical protein B5C34_07630 [Pacificimonas flava]|uniref:histidine kinase n=2 Tax=Pacificimonas TaxID=1960290 RepID=A0A219B6B9_9SPHN|nr:MULTISPECIES: PAS domain-containing sensor histidine kinase [Pacificimonas]MBZ6379469.1 PAS-domain containing protein [Pacificimonas aurantium]OWV33338.1 hypothetical protein B5C34_07630 [Pacificimonas flava]